MARGEFERSITLSRDRADVWNTITDVKQVGSWISIVDSVVEEVPLERYTAVLEDRLGPFRLRADLQIAVSELNEGSRLEAEAEGIDRQIGSRLAVTASLGLEESDEGTVLHLFARYEVTGKVASLGDSAIRRKAAKIVGEFFSNAGRELGAISEVAE